MCEGIVDLKGPDAFVVDSVRGYAPLLTKGPQANGPIRTPREALQTMETGEGDPRSRPSEITKDNVPAPVETLGKLAFVLST